MSRDRTPPHDAPASASAASGPPATAAPGTPGGGRFRVVWEPGSDRLVGVCHCGAERPAEDPNLIWRWLLSHPDHETSGR